MQPDIPITVTEHLESLGIDSTPAKFAAWIRDDLGFRASDEHVERAFIRVQDAVAMASAQGRSTTMHELTHFVAAELPPPGDTHIDAFGGSTWRID